MSFPLNFGKFSPKFSLNRDNPVLTEGSGQLLGLVIVHHGHAEGVEGHHTKHHPVEALSLHHAADEEAEHLLLPPEVGRALVLPTLQTGAGKGRPWDRKKSHHSPSRQEKKKKGWKGFFKHPKTQLSGKLGMLRMG